VKLVFSCGLLGHTLRLSITPNDVVVAGINSNLPNGKHILMIDFDDVVGGLKDVVRECKRINRIAKKRLGRDLGYVEIYESSYRHYFAFWFESELDYVWEAIPLLREAKCDVQYKKWRMVRDEMTLRLTPKKDKNGVPRLVAVVGKYKKKLKEGNEALRRVVHSILDTSKLERGDSYEENKNRSV